MPMSCMPDMMSLAATVAPSTGNIVKNGLRVFERGGNLQKFSFRFRTH